MAPATATACKWMTDDDVMTCLGVGLRALDRWEEGPSKAISRVLGKKGIRSKRAPSGERFWWGFHIRKVKRALVSADGFSDPRGAWVPMLAVQSSYPRLQQMPKSWLTEACPLLPKQRRVRSDQRPAVGGDLRGIRLVRFLLASDLDAILTSLAREESDPDLVTKADATVEFETSDSTIERLLADGTIKGHTRAVEHYRNGSPYLEHFVLFSRTELTKVFEQRRAAPTVKGETLVRPDEAEALTGGDFKAKTMEYWEDHPCRYLDRKLTVVRQKGDERGRTPKYYVPSEILEAHRRYLEAKEVPAGRKSAAGIFERNGCHYLTVRAAKRELGVSQRDLEAWHAKGWIEAIKEAIAAPGNIAATTMYREDGERGFLRLAKLKSGKRYKRITEDDVAKLDSSPKEQSAASVDAKSPLSLDGRDLSRSRQKQKWCYEQYVAKKPDGSWAKKLNRILEAGKGVWGERAPKSESDIVNYATRWASLNKLPIPRRN